MKARLLFFASILSIVLRINAVDPIKSIRKVTVSGDFVEADIQSDSNPRAHKKIIVSVEGYVHY